jgi:hypothetical protein
MSKVVYSVFIDIPEDQLDNPGWFDDDVQVTTDKSMQTKQALLNNYDKVVERQKQYAKDIGATYILYEWDEDYQVFMEIFESDFPEVSHYDIVNFYKHWLMRNLAKTYDYICYIDFDVVPNTKDCIFKAHDMEKFGCANSNALAAWGKTIDSKDYNTCIRNPSTKYWNAHAMLLETGHEADNDVFNTGIMVASKWIIEKLDYFGSFRENIDLMTSLKYDEESMYPHNIRRVFGYDNESLFSYLINSRHIKVEFLNGPWHYIVDETIDNAERADPHAKLYHCINKKMEWFL